LEPFPFFSIYNIKEFLETQEAAVRKKWGQNFLIDPNIIEIILQSIPMDSISKSECILEIGPGLGALTHKLPQFQKETHLIEIDPILAQNLQRQDYIIDHKMNLIHGDVLDHMVSFSKKKLYLFGNLPYYISSEILTMALKTCAHLTGGIFMLQKEFAMRIEKEVSSLSLFARAFGTWKIVKIVKPNCFYPAPSATSAVLLYHPHPVPKVSHSQINGLEKILKSMFWGKRKTISHILKYTPFLNEVEKEKVLEYLKSQTNQSLSSRPEDLADELYYQLGSILD
jgi:16S rRNA (adenine1518-N6/adenine1519-N6)-dimethyltransferase